MCHLDNNKLIKCGNPCVYEMYSELCKKTCLIQYVNSEITFWKRGNSYLIIKHGSFIVMDVAYNVHGEYNIISGILHSDDIMNVIHNMIDYNVMIQLVRIMNSIVSGNVNAGSELVDILNGLDIGSIRSEFVPIKRAN